MATLTTKKLVSFAKSLIFLVSNFRYIVRSDKSLQSAIMGRELSFFQGVLEQVRSAPREQSPSYYLRLKKVVFGDAMSATQGIINRMEEMRFN